MASPDNQEIVGRLYRIEDDDGMFYIGSTTRSLEERFKEHKAGISKRDQGNISPMAKYYAKKGWDGVRITLIREMTCSKIELLKAEGELIQQHIDNPKCHNAIVTGKGFPPRPRLWEKEHSALTKCECGDYITSYNLESHRLGTWHIQRMALMKPEPTLVPPEDDQEEMVVCECGNLYRRCNEAYHLTTDLHLLRMKVKNTEIPDLSGLPIPPECPRPAGVRGKGPYCKCPCGLFSQQREYKSYHLPSLKHKQAMLALMGDPVEADQADAATYTERRAEKSKQTQVCPCGTTVSIRCIRAHQATERHRYRMTLLPVEKEPEESEVDDDKPQEKSVLDSRVKCECGSLVLRSGLVGHLRSDAHSTHLALIEAGQPAAVPYTTAMVELVLCECGKRMRHSQLPLHIKSKYHKAHTTAKAEQVEELTEIPLDDQSG